jgi:mono/diheme cytochrome c family protein
MQSAIWLLLGGLLCGSVVEQPEPLVEAPPHHAAEAEIDFQRDVQPLFARHCYKCHGAEKQSGGLRLDRRSSAEQSGETGAPILRGDEAENVILLRVCSENSAERMPKNAEPLAAEEIDVLRRWVKSGAPWPATVEDAAEAALDANAAEDEEDEEDDAETQRGASENKWSRSYRQFEVNHRDEITIVQRSSFALLPLLLMILFIERAKANRKAGTLPATGRWAVVQRVLCRVPRSAYLAAVFALVFTVTIILTRGAIAKLEIENSQLQDRLAKLEKKDPVTLFGDPPIPIRPSHVSRLGGVYYRGNCERNEQLFNGGNYLTALIRVALYGPERQQLQRGDRVKANAPLYVHLEIKRAPNAATSLFAPPIMKRIFLSSQYLRAGEEERAPAINLESVEKGERWSVDWPIPLLPQTDGRIKGLVYVYKERNTDETPAEAHYGIGYDLLLEGGTISEDSEIWMAPLYLPGQVIPPTPGKLPLCEWFDDRPLPVIERTNTKDPKLLGVEEHLGKADGGSQGAHDLPPESNSEQPPVP